MCRGYGGDLVMCVYCVLWRGVRGLYMWGYVVGLVVGGICGVTRGFCLVGGQEVH